ncbi:MAG: exonuclease SbcD [Candidatus Magnetoglobus multicellularis str. Araruama]|uniref:Nuclease SbcCD subunit D n=1 Tax=Candidatus Magnetoglobus multicellularis str. Araruama TaxID=890399 RepID=A0A1V1P1D9_9BACT|nr:MAG: exonuclease SbcD [Candidatus Magnetoglobus multicellularis str. Araruama]
MKILHTSDWHLGHQLCKQDRKKEHEYFINWLLKTIDKYDISVLIISGDIFDSGFPPNYALAQYYDFLRRLSETCCHHAIVVGGNHDMPSTLNAPRDILRYFQIHVFGGAESENKNQVVPIQDKQHRLICIVCAVPFLRARELKLNHTGETYSQKDRSLVRAMINHYQQVADHAQTIMNKWSFPVPMIATGHLFTAGGKISDTERDLYVGQSKHIPVNQLPKIFDYIALGHLHHCQRVRETPPVYYSGSPIPLSFNESRYKQYVLLIDFDSNNIPSVQKELIPRFRPLIKIKGQLQDIESKLSHLTVDQSNVLTPWIEIDVQDEKPSPGMIETMTALCENQALKLLKIICQPSNIQSVEFQAQKLDELKPIDVFQKRCEADGISGDNYDSLMDTFKELMFLVQSQPDNPED